MSCLKLGAAPQQQKIAKILQVSQNQNPIQSLFWLELTFLNRMSFIDSIHNPFPFTSLVQEICFWVASAWYSTLAQWNNDMYSTGKCVCERLISSGAHYQLHCKWIQPVFTALLLPSGMKFSIHCSSPQRGEGVPPGQKLSDTSSKATRGDNGCQWALIMCYFPRYPPSSIDFSLFSSSNLPVR